VCQIQGREEGRKKERKRERSRGGGREKNDRQVGRKGSTIEFSINRELFSLECRKLRGLICVTTPADLLTEYTRATFPSNLPNQSSIGKKMADVHFTGDNTMQTLHS